MSSESRCSPFGCDTLKEQHSTVLSIKNGLHKYRQIKITCLIHCLGFPGDHVWPMNAFKEEHSETFPPDSAGLKCNYQDSAAHLSPNKPSQQKSQDALLKQLMRHGLTSERRCYRELGGHPSSHSKAAFYWLLVCRTRARS